MQLSAYKFHVWPLHLFFAQKIVCLLRSFREYIFSSIHSQPRCLHLYRVSRMRYRSFRDVVKLSVRKVLRRDSQNVSSRKVLPLFHQWTALFSFLVEAFLRSERGNWEDFHASAGFECSITDTIAVIFPKIIFPLAKYNLWQKSNKFIANQARAWLKSLHKL